MLTSRFQTARRRLVEDERGMTLVELLVGIMAASLVVMAGYGMLNVALTSQTRTADRIDAVGRGRTAMERITRDIRSQQCLDSSTPAMQWAGNTGMQFYTSVAEDSIAKASRTGQSVPSGQPVERRRVQWEEQPERIRLKGSGEAIVGDIVEYVWKSPQTAPPYSFPLNWDKKVILAEDVEKDPAVPLFRYYGYVGYDADTQGGAAPPQVGRPSDTPFSANNAGSFGPGVSSANLPRIVLVDIRYLSRPRRQRNGGRPADPVAFSNRVSVRTADPSDPSRSPLCL